MDKLSNQEENQLKKAIQEIGLEKPSRTFTSNLLNALEAKMVKKRQPASLLSTKGWVIIGFVFAACCSIFFLYPNEGIKWFRALEQLNGQFPQGIFEDIKISKTAVLAISLMGLFLIQLPFLMQLVNKQRNLE